MPEPSPVSCKACSRARTSSASTTSARRARRCERSRRSRPRDLNLLRRPFGLVDKGCGPLADAVEAPTRQPRQVLRLVLAGFGLRREILLRVVASRFAFPRMPHDEPPLERLFVAGLL